MTHCEQLYYFYKEYPEADAATVMKGLDWENQEVRRYKFRLKKRGFIAIDKQDGKESIVLLKPYNPEQEEPETFAYKQEVYRQLVETLQDRMADQATTTTQTIEISREIRIIMKEII
jgi:hypothetical protein